MIGDLEIHFIFEINKEDVSPFWKNLGSVFLCSLDAKGAFDALHHSVLFDCAW